MDLIIHEQFHQIFLQDYLLVYQIVTNLQRSFPSSSLWLCSSGCLSDNFLHEQETTMDQKTTTYMACYGSNLGAKSTRNIAKYLHPNRRFVTRCNPSFELQEHVTFSQIQQLSTIQATKNPKIMYIISNQYTEISFRKVKKG